MPARIARSDGGAEQARTIRERPVVALLSGPAAGVAGAADAAEDAGWEDADLMTLDVGGTSADIGVIRGGAPVLSSEEQVGDFPVLIPTVAVSSIGAGGGSIIWLDSTGSLKVGPRSVGADPGPACYGSGSTVPARADRYFFGGGVVDSRPAPGWQAGAAAGAGAGGTGDDWRAVGLDSGASRRWGSPRRYGDDGGRGDARAGSAWGGCASVRMVAFGGAGPLLGALIAGEIAIDTISRFLRSPVL